MALTFQRIHISKAIIETLERDEPPPVPPALPVASSIGMPISNISSSPPQSRQQRRPTAAPTTLKPAVTESDLISGEVTDSSTSELRKRRQYYQPPSPSLSPLRAISSLAPALSNFPASLTPALHSPGQEVDQTNLFRHRSRECIRERDDFDGYVEESRDHQNRWRRRQHRSRRSHSRSFESKGDLEENADNAEDGNVGSRRHKLLEAGLIGDEETQNENRSTPSKRRRLHHECRNSEERRERRRRWERREMESPAPQPSVDLLARNERQVATSRLVPAETVITRDREDEALSDPGTPTRDEQPFSLQPEHHGATGLDPKEEGTRKVELTLSEQSQDDRSVHSASLAELPFATILPLDDYSPPPLISSSSNCLRAAYLSRLADKASNNLARPVSPTSQTGGQPHQQVGIAPSNRWVPVSSGVSADCLSISETPNLPGPILSSSSHEASGADDLVASTMVLSERDQPSRHEEHGVGEYHSRCGQHEHQFTEEIAVTQSLDINKQDEADHPQSEK